MGDKVQGMRNTERYEVWITWYGDEVAELGATFTNWNAAAGYGNGILDAQDVVIVHQDPPNSATYWIRGGRKLQRDGYGYVATA